MYNLVRKMSHKLDEMEWEMGCGDLDADYKNLKMRLQSIIGYHTMPKITAEGVIFE